MATTTTAKRTRTSQPRTVSTAAKKVVARKTVAKKPAARKVATKTVAAKKPVVAKSAPRKSAVPAKSRVIAAKKPAVAPRKAAKPTKVKMVRVGLSLPKHELALLRDLKKRAKKLGQEFKKSHILRAGLAHLLGMTDTVLKGALAKVERVQKKTAKKRGKR